MIKMLKKRKEVMFGRHSMNVEATNLNDDTFSLSPITSLGKTFVILREMK